MNDEHESPAGLHTVFVVALEAEVMNTRKFTKINPGYRPGQPCYNVDVTDLAVDLRFDRDVGREYRFDRLPGFDLT